ncbi:MAG: phenylacetic acid degradation bifunctional protein PaaZ [Pseudomonadota bacterium]
MSVHEIRSFVEGDWVPFGNQQTITVNSAVTGEPVALVGQSDINFHSVLDHARNVGGPALRAIGFHDRARLLKALALHLDQHKEELYALSHTTGATRADAKIDVDGGIGTMLVYASKGRRELPDSSVWLDGNVEMLSRKGTFVGQHILTPKLGVAVHINAFNFPVWGMLEKLAPTLLAGMPAVVKPATPTCHVTEACFRMMIDSGILPEGSVQLIVGATGDLLDRLNAQDTVSFTGSAKTALSLKSKPRILRKSVTFVAEQDSLNATVLGQDAAPGSAEFDILVKEVVTEMTAKAGQKCTAIRRIFVPQGMQSAVADAIAAKLDAIRIGDPANRETQLGALVSLAQRDDVMAKVTKLREEADVVFDGSAMNMGDVDVERGAFLAPHLLMCDDADAAKHLHEIEAFGPVSTIMTYRDTQHASALLNRGGGSLVTSVITHDPDIARDIALGTASHHGRIYINNRDSAGESTGHGAPLPHMTHGGPGRAGGGEELGGIRGMHHYMQRTAIQGSPDMISAVVGTWVPGSTTHTEDAHPFTKGFDALKLGETFLSDSRTVTLEDIETFAHFTGDTFYAHMDEEAAKANPFFPGRVAHGYLLLSFAAGLFVQPDPGPVLANTGLSDLAFQKPVSPGDSISVTLTVRRKTRRTEDYGEVRWHVVLTNQDDETVATYTLHTMNAYSA